LFKGWWEEGKIKKEINGGVACAWYVVDGKRKRDKKIKNKKGLRGDQSQKISRKRFALSRYF
jgi:hypothetical protein